MITSKLTSALNPHSPAMLKARCIFCSNLLIPGLFHSVPNTIRRVQSWRSLELVERCREHIGIISGCSSARVFSSSFDRPEPPSPAGARRVQSVETWSFERADPSAHRKNIAESIDIFTTQTLKMPGILCASRSQSSPKLSSSLRPELRIPCVFLPSFDAPGHSV